MSALQALSRLFGFAESAVVACCGTAIHASVEAGRLQTTATAIPHGQLCYVGVDGLMCAAGYNLDGFPNGYLSVFHPSQAVWLDRQISHNGVFNACFHGEDMGWALAGSYGGNMVWGTSDGGQNWSRLPPKK